MRRHTVKPAPSTGNSRPKAVFTGPHAHGCIQCRGRYEDNCATSNVNDKCRGCRGQMVWELLRQNRLPRDCCRTHSRLASTEDRKRYSLSPACDWFLCTACHRTQPFSNPTEVQS